MNTADVYLTAAYPENIWMALLKPYGSGRGPGVNSPEKHLEITGLKTTWGWFQANKFRKRAARNLYILVAKYIKRKITNFKPKVYNFTLKIINFGQKIRLIKRNIIILSEKYLIQSKYSWFFRRNSLF